MLRIRRRNKLSGDACMKPFFAYRNSYPYTSRITLYISILPTTIANRNSSRNYRRNHSRRHRLQGQGVIERLGPYRNSRIPKGRNHTGIKSSDSIHRLGGRRHGHYKWSFGFTVPKRGPHSYRGVTRKGVTYHTIGNRKS